MTTTAPTETAAPDNGEPPATGGDTETPTAPADPPATGGADEADDSTVTDDDGDDEAGRLKFYQRLSREQETELKRLRKAEEERARAEMSEADRLKADLAARDAELADLKRSQTLARISAEHGLTAELAERLRGDTEEELTEDAKRLAELVGKRPPAPPAPEAGIGTRGGDTLPTDPLELSRRFMTGR